MYKGVTPTFTFTLPKSVDLTYATNVYVTFEDRKRNVLLTKGSEDLVIDENTVEVYLSQEETLSFPDERIDIQINWTYSEGPLTKRACSEVVNVVFKRNLLNEVLE